MKKLLIPLALLISVFLTSCGSSVTTPPTISKPIIVSFTASPSSIFEEETTTLSWSITSSETATISISSLGTLTSNETTVSPNTTTTYTLTATNSAGSTTKDLTVTVEVEASPPTTPPSTSNGVYDVVNGEIVGELSTAHQVIWDLVLKIIPLEGRQMLASVEMSNANPDNAGSVVETEEDFKWDMYISDDYDNDLDELAATIVHEYMHIVSLNETQVPDIEDTCNTYDPGEGCARVGSYIYQFVKKFWLGKHDLEKGAAEGATGFVSDYAKTNPVEDIAESYTAYVARKEVTDPIAKEKLSFFDSFPELVELANRIYSAVPTILAP